MAATSNELSGQSQKLQDVISFFKTGDSEMGKSQLLESPYQSTSEEKKPKPELTTKITLQREISTPVENRKTEHETGIADPSEPAVENGRDITTAHTLHIRQAGVEKMQMDEKFEEF